MPFAKINGIDLYYEIHGIGKPLVFLSGFSTHHMTWFSFIEPFKNDFQMVLLDNRGAGQTTAPTTPYTIETMADDTIALLDQLEIMRASFIGSSMGTAISQTIAYKYPDRIDKGALIAPFHKLPAASIYKIATTGKLMEANVPIELIIDTVIPWLFSNTFVRSPEKYQEKAKEMSHNPHIQTFDGFKGQFEALINFDSSSFLSKIDAEMLILAGEEDLSSPLWCAKYLYDHLKRSTLHTFPHVGHMAHVERRNEVIDLIKKHLE